MLNNRIERIGQFAGIFKALSNVSRLQIFSRLASCCAAEKTCFIDPRTSACVGEIARDFNLAPSTVSHHIKKLHSSGLIRMERQGQSVRCWIAPEAVRELEQFFHSLTPSVISATDRTERGKAPHLRGLK
jgi:ArsR family transcriptional regulator